MKLSTRSTYGMRALVELGLSGGRGPVSAAVIAKRQGLSVAYLEQLLHRLKRQGIVNSIRGPRGGYLLTKQPQRVTVGDVVRVLDGAGSTGQGNGQHGARRNGSKSKNGKGHGGPLRQDLRHAQRIAQVVWHCVHERLAQSLDGVTLQDLCDEVLAQAGEPLDHRYVFHI